MPMHISAELAVYVCAFSPIIAFLCLLVSSATCSFGYGGIVYTAERRFNILVMHVT
jgi:hypothetical protein